MYFISSCIPPGYWGCCSTISKTFSSSGSASVTILLQVGNILSVLFVVTYHVGNRDGHLCLVQLFLALHLVLVGHFFILLDDRGC